MKIMGQPHKKACNLKFHEKICGNFFKAPLTRVKNFMDSPLESGSLDLEHAFLHVLFFP